MFEVTSKPYICTHYNDDGSVSGRHVSRWWTVRYMPDRAVLVDCPECLIKWQQVLTNGCTLQVEDTITPLITSHSDWDPAPPPRFGGQNEEEACKS